MTTDSLTLATQAGAHATLSPAVLRLFGQATPAVEAVEAAIPTARAYHYGPETASLFEAVSEVVYPSDGGTALKPQIREGWRTYNFEVEDLHTYIAGGLRVHNTSLPALVPRGAQEVVFTDTDGDGKWDKADYKLGGGVSETIHGRDTDGDGTTDLVKRIKTIPREELLGPQDKVVWEETYQGTSTVPSEKKIVGIEYAPGTLQGEEAGRTLGSVLGSAIGGSNIFAQVGSATITATLLQNVGELLHKGVQLSLLSLDGHNVSPLDAAITDTFKDFGQDLVGNAKVQVIGALSGVLVGEIADALNLQGFERGLFSTVGNTVTNQVLTNVAMMTGIKEIPATLARENLNLLTGFDAANMAANVGNSLGGFFGSQLGQKAVRPHNEQASLFGSAGSAIGAYIGTLSGLPIIGPMIGSFIGQTIGAGIGNGAFDRDDAVRITMYTRDEGLVDTGSFWINPGTKDTFVDLASQIANFIKFNVNSLNANAGLILDVNHSFNAFQVGVYINRYNNRRIINESGDFEATPENINGVIAGSVDYIFANSEAIGGDLFARRAYTASHKEGLTRLSFDLRVAKDFKKYIDNTSVINSMIADAPDSAFSAGWIATLQRAKELGLNRLVDFNALEYLASYGDLQQAFGRDKAAAERHMIEHGIPEGRRIHFDALEYLAANPGLAQALGGIDRDRAVNHYLDYGRNEGRPTRFDATQYVAANRDLAQWLGANEPEKAMRHYIENGYREGRTTSFDYRQYLAANPGLKEELGGVDPTKAARHYIETGMREGLPTQFNNYAYLASRPDLWNAFGRNFGALHQHVLDYDLQPITFDVYDYLNAHPDLQAAFGTNLEAAAEHFIVHGRNESWRSATWIGSSNERTIVGGAGRDTISYAYTSTGLVVDLNAQRTWNGHSGDNLISIENIIGSRFNDTLIGTNGDNILDGYGGSDTIHGNGGSDTISFAHNERGVVIDFWNSQTWDGRDGVKFTSIENAIGSRFNDDIHGNNEDNVLEGYGGSDTIRGNGGSDTVSFMHSERAVIIGLDNQITWDGRDNIHLTSIENGIGSRYNDTLVGDNGDNVFEGGGGSDTIWGNGGSDTVSFMHSERAVIIGLDNQITWDGRDNIHLTSIENGIGSRFNDTLVGDNGDNVFEGGGGSDTIWGNGGSDTVSFMHSERAVIIGLDNQITWDGRDNIHLTSIENGIGSRFNDTLVGDNGDNVFEGGGGSDTIWGNGGSDTVSFMHSERAVIIGLDNQITWDGRDNIHLTSIENGIGSRFNDTLVGDNGDNVFEGGGGSDTIWGNGGSDTVSFMHSERAVIIGLDNQITWDGRDNIHLTSIENGIGSRFNDTLVGDNGDNVFEGGGGSDTIWGNGGSDTISFAHNDRGVVIDFWNSQTWDGRDGVKFTSIENAIGSRYDDDIHGNNEDNILTGGAGADRFNANSGRDTITDFNAAEGDRVVLHGQSYWTNTSQNGSALLMLSHGGTIELRGIAPGSVNAGWFA